MRVYPKCRICGKPTKYYHSNAHTECLKGNNHPLFEKRNKPIYQCAKDGTILTQWKSMSEVERITNGRIKAHALFKVLHGERKTHKGFIWKFV